MKKNLFTIFCIILLSAYSYATDCEQQVKKLSDKAVKNCETFDDKVLALRRYVHDVINKAPSIGAIKPNGEVMTAEEYYDFRDRKRFLMNTIDKLDFGYEWCDGSASVFMHFAKKQNIKTRMVYLRVTEKKDGILTLKSPHTIAEALSPDNRWVIVDTDPTYDLVLFNKDDKIASREDIKQDKSILYVNPLIRKNPALWGSKDYLSMFYNNLAAVLDYEQTSRTYHNLKHSAIE